MRAGQQLSFVLFTIGLLVPVFESTRSLNAHESTDASLFYTSTDNLALISLPGSSYPLCSIQDHDHRHAFPDDLTTAKVTNSPSSHLPPTAPSDSIPQNAAAGATEHANNAANASSQAEVTTDLAAPLSAPTAPRPPPLAACPSVEIEAAVFEPLFPVPSE
jgi:hypothetical protein